MKRDWLKNDDLKFVGFVAFCIFLITFLIPEVASAQLLEPIIKDQGSAPVKSLTKAEQSKLVRAIYDQTKTVKTTKDYTEMLADIEAAIAQGLSVNNVEYVTSLKGWALNRRGEKRFEFATRLKSVGNSQFESVLQQAMGDFDSAIIADPQRYRSWSSRGKAYIEMDEYRKAVNDFTEVIKLKTDLASAWFNRAECLFLMEEFEKSKNDFEVAIRLNSKDCESITGRAHCLAELGLDDEAFEAYSKVIEMLPESEIAFLNRADFCFETGQYKKANADYQQAMELNESALTLQRMARFNATCPDPEFQDATNALTLIQKAIKLEGETPVNLDTLAAVEARSGDFGNATKSQQQAIKLVSSEGDGELYRAKLALYEQEKPFDISLASELSVDSEDGRESESAEVENK